MTASLSASNFTATGSTLASDYTLPTSASGAGKITARTVTGSIVNTPTKTYDGTTAATLSASNFSLSNLVSGEGFTVTQTAGTYNNAHVANAITVTATLAASDFTAASGTTASDYSLPTSTSGAGRITARGVTAAIIGTPTKTYDGSTSATLSAANFSLSNLVGGESFAVTQTAGTYNSTHVASANTVTTSLSGSHFTAASGTTASDYSLPTSASGAGRITARTVTAAIIGTPTKTYDGKTSAVLTAANFSLSNLVSGESFTVTQAAGTYNSVHVASATTVTTTLAASDFTAASGTTATDYSLPTSASGAGRVTAFAFTYQIQNLSKVFGNPANLAQNLGTTINTGVNGENLAIAYSSDGAAVSATVGAYPITGLLSDGTGRLSDYGPTLRNATLTVTLPSGAAAYVLNANASGAVTASGNAVVTLSGGLYVDSSSTSAVLASGNARVNVGGIVQIVGGASVSGNAVATKTGTPGATNDPLASLTAPGVTGTPVAIRLSGHDSLTLNPGLYSQIQISGQASLTLTPGIYVIAGGGLAVSGQGSVTGTGVTIYNAGSGYAYNPSTGVVSDGGTFGSISLGGNGTFTLSAPASGPYTNVAIFQSRTNSRPLSLSGNAAAGLTGTVYAAAAEAGLSGNAQLTGSLVVATLSVTGNAGAFQLADGASSDYASSTSPWISNGLLTVAAQDDTGHGLDAEEVARLGDAMAYVNHALASFGVQLSWAVSGTRGRPRSLRPQHPPGRRRRWRPRLHHGRERRLPGPGVELLHGRRSGPDRRPPVRLPHPGHARAGSHGGVGGEQRSRLGPVRIPQARDGAACLHRQRPGSDQHGR